MPALQTCLPPGIAVRFSIDTIPLKHDADVFSLFPCDVSFSSNSRLGSSARWLPGRTHPFLDLYGITDQSRWLHWWSEWSNSKRLGDSAPISFINRARLLYPSAVPCMVIDLGMFDCAICSTNYALCQSSPRVAGHDRGEGPRHVAIDVGGNKDGTFQYPCRSTVRSSRRFYLVLLQLTLAGVPLTCATALERCMPPPIGTLVLRPTIYGHRPILRMIGPDHPFTERPSRYWGSNEARSSTCQRAGSPVRARVRQERPDVRKS